MKTLFIITLYSSITISSFAQSSYQNVQISNQFGPNEVSICIDPKNTNQLVAGANLNSYYYSTNAGLNWARGTLTSSLYGVWGDPCIIVDTAGAFYYFHLSNPPGGNWIDRIVCQKSTNGGVNWSNPGTYMGLNPPKAQDKEWACVDRTNNRIYVTWTEFDFYGSGNSNDSTRILFSRNSDGGTTWSPALRINKLSGDCRDLDNTVEGAVPCVGPNGEIYTAWSGPVVFNSQFGIFFDKSTDGGNTWLANDILATYQPGGWVYNIPGIYRCNGLPITCCDISNGPYRGSIYINYTDSAGPNDVDVKIVKSTNGGLNWSAPIRVNDDPAGRHQFFTWMTIDQITGHIYIVFYDRRNYTDFQTDVFIARSTDGGSTFINERISAGPFIPNSGTFFGDYNNITAHNGIIRPMWTRLSSGVLSVWTAIIDIPIGNINYETQLPSNFVLEQNYPNPFNSSTVIKFQIPKTAFITLKVFDALGRDVATLSRGKFEPGIHEIFWDAGDYSSGVYYYKIETSDNSFNQSKKMVIMK